MGIVPYYAVSLKAICNAAHRHINRFLRKSPLKRVIPHSVGKCRGATKGTLSRQELSANEVSRLRD